MGGGWSVSFQPLICLAHTELGGGRWSLEIPKPNSRAGNSAPLAEGEVLDQRDPRDCCEPQFWLCWEQEEHRDCCRALGCSGNPVSSLSPGSRHRALHSAQNPWGAAQPLGGRATLSQESPSKGQTRGQRAAHFPLLLLPFPPPVPHLSHPTPHLLLLQLLQAWLLCLVQNSCWEGLLAPCTTLGFAFLLLLLLLCCLFFCLPLLPLFPFVLPVGACRLW